MCEGIYLYMHDITRESHVLFIQNQSSIHEQVSISVLYFHPEKFYLHLILRIYTSFIEFREEELSGSTKVFRNRTRGSEHAPSRMYRFCELMSIHVKWLQTSSRKKRNRYNPCERLQIKSNKSVSRDLIFSKRSLHKDHIDSNPREFDVPNFICQLASCREFFSVFLEEGLKQRRISISFTQCKLFNRTGSGFNGCQILLKNQDITFNPSWFFRIRRG